MKEEIVYIIRRFQTISSIIIFLIVLALCWVTADLNITKIQLSHWSNIEKISTFWNNSLVMLGITTWVNQWVWLSKHKRMTRTVIPRIMFTIVSTCLVFTGIFSMDYKIAHNIFAFSYFLLYPFAIFATSYLNRTNIRWNNWITMMVTSVAMIVIPISLIPIWSGMAPSELAHSALVIWWNIWILTKGVN